MFNKDNRNSDGLQVKCKDCFKEYRLNNKQKREEWKKNNTEYYSQYYKKNKEKYFLYDKEKRSKYSSNYQKKRRNSDNLFKIQSIFRVRTSLAFKSKGYKKNTKTEKMLGCSYEKVKTYIEKQFEKGMNWDNHGEWHIDHIYPLSKAKTEKELIELCHYRNLQPLWANENYSKKDKIITHQRCLNI